MATKKDMKPTTKTPTKGESSSSRRVGDEKGERSAQKRGAASEKSRPGRGLSWRINLTESQRWVICFFLFFVSAFVTLSVVSHYFTWSVDQMGEGVSNSGGSWGLAVARIFVGDWFGVAALCIPAAGFVLAYVAVSGRVGVLGRVVKILLSAMIVGSVSLGFIFGANGTFGSGLGGKMGIDIAVWLAGHIGRSGVGLLLFMCWILLALYINSTRTIEAMNLLARKTASIFRRRGEELGSEVADEYAEADAVLPAEEEYVPATVAVAPVRAEAAEEVLFEEFEREEPFIETEDVSADPERVDGDLEIIVPQEEDVLTEIDVQREDEEPETAAQDAAQESVAPKSKTDELFTEIDEDGLLAEIEQGEAQTAVATTTATAATAAVATQLGDEFEIVDTEIVGMEGLPATTTKHPAAPQELSASAGDGILGTGGVVETDEFGEVQVVRDEHSDEEAGRVANLYDPTKELSRFKHPPLEILERHDADGVQYSVEEINENKNLIKQTLDSFGVKIRKITATIGPTVTLYEIEPEMGVKVARIKSLENDIAISLKAQSIRLIIPMPGRGTIGIEIPNRTRCTVSMYSVLRSKKFQESKYALPVVIGKTIQNETFVFDLADMPHMIVAGATGQGKSVGLNAIIASLIYKRHPAELKFVMVDPKKVELSLYSKLENHYLAKMESEEEAILTDTQKVVYTLNSLCIEMEERYKLLRAAGVKRIDAYNRKFLERKLHPRFGHRFLPYLVVIIDEFADMIMTAGKEVETPIQRLGQLARAIGIHLIIATQRPDAKVITGLISANCPARIGFKVSNSINSRIILGEPGAEKLVGKGDMLIQINGEMTRLQCAFIDTPEIERITDFISKQQGYTSAYLLPDYVPEEGEKEEREDIGELDPRFEEIARFVVAGQQGSTSFIQRKYRIGYNRAGRIMDQLEAYGIVGRSEGGRPREVLISDTATLEKKLNDIFIDNLQ